MNITEFDICSIEEFSSLVFRISGTTDDVVWFRGQGNHTYGLSPSLFRKQSVINASMMSDEESYFMYKFDLRGRPYIKERVVDEFEKLFMMQHYGFPTRLLDWSENPYIGLYFALDNVDVDGSVYILKPSYWNECSLISRGPGMRKIFNTDDVFVNNLRPSKMKEGHLHTLALYATHNTTRIIAQRGVFTIFGASPGSMDSQFNSFDDHEHNDILIKVRVPAINKAAIRVQLHRMGITESVIFPIWSI